MADTVSPPTGGLGDAGAIPLVDWRERALFLDFDGTLAPLVDRPEDARPSGDTLALLDRLAHATQGAIAIVSGRALDDLAQRVGPLPLALSGSHGLEIRLADGRALPPAQGEGGLDAAFADLKPLADEAGLLIEDKPGSVALHYRNRPEDADHFRQQVAQVAARHDLRLLHGHMVSEAALRGIDKGAALRRLMQEPAFAGRRPVMIGDDTTDEDGFRAAQAMGGFGLRIGDVETAARHRVARLGDALSWLGRTIDAG